MRNLYYLIDSTFYLITYASYIIVGLALLYFFWGLASLVLTAGEDEKRKENIKRITWGLGILFVMLSIAGIINIIQYTFRLDVYPRQDIHNLIEEL